MMMRGKVLGYQTTAVLPVAHIVSVVVTVHLCNCTDLFTRLEVMKKSAIHDQGKKETSTTFGKVCCTLLESFKICQSEFCSLALIVSQSQTDGFVSSFRT